MPEPTDPWVWLARIRRPQGRKGEVFAEILTDFPEKFAERRQALAAEYGRVYGGGRAVGCAVAAAGGAQEPLAAQGRRCAALCGRGFDHRGRRAEWMVVAIPRAERAALGEDEVYVGDLIGCVLVDVAGAEAVDRGRDRECGPERRSGAAAGGARREGRSAGSVCKELSAQDRSRGRRVEMALPEGLVDLSKADEA